MDYLPCSGVNSGLFGSLRQIILCGARGSIDYQSGWENMGRRHKSFLMLLSLTLHSVALYEEQCPLRTAVPLVASVPAFIWLHHAK